MVRLPFPFQPHTAAADAPAEEGAWEVNIGPRTRNLLRLTYHASRPFQRPVFEIPPHIGEVGAQMVVIYTHGPEDERAQIMSLVGGRIAGALGFNPLHHAAFRNLVEQVPDKAATPLPFGVPKENAALALVDGAGEDLCDWAFHADPMSLIETVKQGLSPDIVPHLACSMLVSQEKVLSTLGLPKATYQRKARKNQALSSDESSRVMGMARLIGQAQAMVNESGTAEGFVAAEWVANWLDEPLPALSNRRPAEYMDTAEGQAMVSQLLASMLSGAYA